MNFNRGSINIIFLFLTVILILVIWTTTSWILSYRKTFLVRSKAIYCHQKLINRHNKYLKEMMRLNQLILAMRNIELTGIASGGTTTAAAKTIRIAAEYRQQIEHIQFLFFKVKNKEKTLPSCVFRILSNISPYRADTNLKLQRDLQTRIATTHSINPGSSSLLKISSITVLYGLKKESKKIYTVFQDSSDPWIF